MNASVVVADEDVEGEGLDLLEYTVECVDRVEEKVPFKKRKMEVKDSRQSIKKLAHIGLVKIWARQRNALGDAQRNHLPVDDDYDDGYLQPVDPKDDQCELVEHVSDSSLDDDDDNDDNDDDDYDYVDDDDNADDDGGGGGANMKIETTATPNDLCCALQGLTDVQKLDMRDMGFQSILSFNIDNIPPGLGHWLLVNCDHQRNQLNVGTHVIEITPSKVRDVLGVPMGEIPVYENKRGKKIDIIRKEWRKQSFRYPAIIFVKHVVEKLKSYTGGGTLFKLNFLVIFNSIMGETAKSYNVNQKFLSSIKNEADISNMDWCSYIITCLKRTKEGWNGKEPYNGPLTFLAVLYAHEQQLRRSPGKAIAPAIQYITTGFLVDFEGSMHVDGSCSNDNIQEDNHITQNLEVQVKFETHIESAQGQTAVGQNVNVQQDEEDEIQLQIDESQTAVDQNFEVQVKFETHIESAQGQTGEGQTVVDQNVNVQQDEVQLQTDESQTGIDQNVNIQQDEFQLQTDESQTRIDQNVNIHQDEDDEVNLQTHDGQTVVDQNVNVQQDEEDEVQLQTDESQTGINQNLSVHQDEEDEVQLQTDESQIGIDQNVNVPQDKEDEDQFQPSNLDSVLNLMLPIGPPCAQSLSGLSTNLARCDRLEQSRDKNLQDDDGVVMLEPKQEQSELAENVSNMLDSVENFSSGQSGIVCVEGYKVKQSVANVLKAILETHGDIAAECVLKTDSMRSSILEAVCEVAMQIQANDITERMEDLEIRVSDAKAVNIDVSWLEAHIQKRKEASEMYNFLMKMKANHLSDINAAEVNLRKRRAELEAAEERSRDAKRRVEALRLVGKNQADNFFESKAKIDSWVMDLIV
ncbi:uncharacterized protein LOC143552439 [Bidens hawaiensis]|uniref:uncharacterized protein LOC143552439 n=1 Tax=Bidens hawaiensis TaxID=980011 RepID=UPI004048ECC3